MGVEIMNRGPRLATLAYVQRQSWRRYGEEGSAPEKDATKKDLILNIFQIRLNRAKLLKKG
jgi:hypothetical protein